MAGALSTLAPSPPAPPGRSILRRRPLCVPATLVTSPRRFLLTFSPPSISEKAPFILRPAAGGSDQAGGGGGYEAISSNNSSELLSWERLLLDFISTNFLPLALVGGVIIGLANPTLGCLAHKYSFTKFSTFGIFFISGLTLRSKEICSAVEAWPAGMFGLGSILLFSPFFSRLLLQIQLDTQEFITGLAIFCCMPTTLSSGVALTQLVGGNSALALAMTVISNLLGIMIVPFSLGKLVGAGVGVSIPTMDLFKSLITTLLIPLILGKVLREAIKSVADYVDQNRRFFSVISAILLSLVPWIQVSRSRSLLLTVKPSAFAIAIGMGTLLHILLLSFNTVAVRSLSVVSGGSRSVFTQKQNARAVIMVASQKTLPVMVAVVEQLKGTLGEPGLLVLPCVGAHIMQIIIDSFLVDLWLRKDRMSIETKEA